MRRTRPDELLALAPEDGFRPAAPPAWMRWLPFAYVAFVLLLEVTLEEEWAVSFFLIALPAIAAYAYGPVAVAAFTLLAILLEGALAAIAHHLGENHHVTADIATALVGILSTALAAHRSRQERSLVHANSVAEALMRALLRPVPHQVGRVLAASLYRPSEAGTMVGGDLFDIRATGAGERAIIGDVRGKGLPAVRTVAAILGSFREAAYEAEDLPAVAARLERRLAREAEEIPDEELFATAVLIEYDSLEHRVTVTNHGHVEPVLISCGEVRVLEGPPALPLGLGDLAAADGPVAWSHPLTRGDVLLLVTDGLVEARDTDGDFYPLVDRLRHRFQGRPAPGPADVVNFLNTDLPRHTRNVHDDVAMLAIAPHDHV
ncbi:PP2C family protein-serine/threonine phosphatase [Streptomyces sp. NBC_01565]|uniref:PP2C family protein-serine/threonine phosphatase n=1 Tax=unclassified Streptomyces TaxID=2593676 RepID=UPI00225BAB7E|nr:PP2C family protein-serine/threonine phosphatase [Streptomyces sp. NBC_01565]MCX4546119.1 serine/threonine-protein phosphatase [Streptomyces sp. NBC_01565]